jgi:hypothetical protein
MRPVVPVISARRDKTISHPAVKKRGRSTSRNIMKKLACTMQAANPAIATSLRFEKQLRIARMQNIKEKMKIHARPAIPASFRYKRAVSTPVYVS